MVDAEKLNKYLTHEKDQKKARKKKRRKKLNVGWFIAEARDIRIYKICAVSLLWLHVFQFYYVYIASNGITSSK